MNFERIRVVCKQALSTKPILEALSQVSLKLSDIPYKQGTAVSEHEIHLIDSSNISVSLITIQPGKYDLAYCYKQIERILYVVEGKLLLTKFSFEDNELMPCDIELLGTGESVRIDAAKPHSVTAWEGEAATLLDIQFGGKQFPIEKISISNDTLIKINQLKKEIKNYYYGYDKRYQKVYECGAESWESHEPNEIIQLMYRDYPYLFKGKIIDLGCGEGRDALYLASLGCNVLGVDVSRAALDKARELALKNNIQVSFLERDVVFLRNIPNANFDLAINMGCMHMLSDDRHRHLHLLRTFEILKPGGHFLLAHCKENWGKGFFSIPHYDEVGPLTPGKIIQRRIRVNGQHKFIPLEVVPYKESREEDLKKELENAGFCIVKTNSQLTDAFGNSVVMLAVKT